jgi:hypothetical protein
MSFWTKKPDLVNAINERSVELRSLAARGLSEAEAVTALGNALGHATAAMQMQHANVPLSEMLDLVTDGVREQAHIFSGVQPHVDNLGDLTEEAFTELVQRIIRIAIANGTLSHDALAAVAKALGTLSAFTARREGRSIEELVAGVQEAVSGFAMSAGTFMLQNPGADPAKIK